jgi:uncharacterized protein YbjT (DUF2867 family)
MNMKIVVMGGSGRIGKRVVRNLQERGHETIPASPSSGVNTMTGEGLASVLVNARVVVDVTNSPDSDDLAVMRFFKTSTQNILAAVKAAHISHHVLLSVVGANRLQDSGYMRAKVTQEELVKTASVPFTILRSTQFFEFLGIIANINTVRGSVRLPPALVQPVAADDVAEALADVAESQPMNGIVELAGPEHFWLNEMVREYLNARGDPRQVKTDNQVRYFGAELDDRSLMPSEKARLGSMSFSDWLAR